MEMVRNGRTYGVSIFNELLAVTIVYTGGEGEVAISFRFSHAGNLMLHMISGLSVSYLYCIFLVNSRVNFGWSSQALSP